MIDFIVWCIGLYFIAVIVYCIVLLVAVWWSIHQPSPWDKREGAAWNTNRRMLTQAEFADYMEKRGWGRGWIC